MMPASRVHRAVRYLEENGRRMTAQRLDRRSTRQDTGMTRDVNTMRQIINTYTSVSLIAAVMQVLLSCRKLPRCFLAAIGIRHFAQKVNIRESRIVFDWYSSRTCIGASPPSPLPPVTSSASLVQLRTRSVLDHSFVNGFDGTSTCATQRCR